jgi:nucleoid DNA-binding protein
VRKKKLKNRIIDQDLIDSVSKKTRTPKDVVERVMEELKAEIVQNLRAGRKVVLWNLGTFTVGERSGRVVNPPGSTSSYEIPPRTFPRFNYSNELVKEFKRDLDPPARFEKVAS